MSKPILCCAIAACPLDHRDANASVMKYLTDFLACATKKEVRTGGAMTEFLAWVTRKGIRKGYVNNSMMKQDKFLT